MTGYETILANFLKGCQDIVNAHFDENFPKMIKPEISMKQGRRYAKVIIKRSTGGIGDNWQSSAFGFVDMNGDVLMAASWDSPAKHARGNIKDKDNGMSAVTPWGMKYL